MNKELWIGIGVPGAGKSTYFKNFKMFDWVKYVSRNEICFALIGDEDEYFSKETMVFDIYVQSIVKGLKDPKITVVIADATHLNPASRYKLLKAIKKRLDPSIHFDKVGFFFHDTLDDCLERNEKRQGTRAYVPRDAIKRMFRQLSMPNYTEDFASIVVVENGRRIYEKPTWL